MTAPFRPASSRLRIILCVVLFVSCALGFAGWVNGKRAQRVMQVSATPQWSVDALTVDATSPTGYAGGRRWLIVPGHNRESYQWIAQTQQMLTSGDWRIRSVAYENAPHGREVHSASPYRWWLGGMAWLDHLASGRPLGQSVERAALFADPVLHGLLLVCVAAFVAWRFGTMSAGLCSLGLVAIFPFSSGFAAGIPNDHGLALASALWSLLFLVAGMAGGSPPEIAPAALQPDGSRRRRGFFILSGMAGGFGMWISVGIQLPVLVGIVVGGVLAAIFDRRDAASKLAVDRPAPPWRAWAISGAAVSLLGFLTEYFPEHMTMHLEVNHPLYALGWLGAGELLGRLTAWIQGTKRGRTRLDRAGGVLAVCAVAAVPVAMVIGDTDVFAQQRQLVARLSVAHDVTASSLAGWIARDGFSLPVVATVLPLTIALVAGAFVCGRGGSHRAALALGLGPLLVTLLYACRELWWWNVVDVMLVVLLATATGAFAHKSHFPRLRWAWCGLVAALLLPGATQILPRPNATKQGTLTSAEGEGFVERDLAHWLVLHAESGTVVALAPPELTTTLCFHGGLNGLGTLNWENQDGINAAVRLVSALSTEEAFALIESRGVTHIVIPSWDSFLDEYARLGARGAADPEGLQRSFIASLHRWDLPAWLRPVAYTLPTGRSGGPSVVILEVVDEQNPSLAMSRLAEYFLEIERIDFATSAARNLDRFPGNVGAMVAIAQVAIAQVDKAAAAAAVSQLLPLLALEEGRPLPFDRRVSLAILLAQYQQNDLARQQIDRCLGELDERRLRSLSTVSLYRLQLLCRLLGREIRDPKLRELARALLSPDLRVRL